MSLDGPKISVIVTNYNHNQYLEQAVKSILNQTYKNVEIIIVDDCSNDNSREVIKEICKLDSRIREPVLLLQNKGKWFALNKAIGERATGELLTAQDADDASLPQRIERQLACLKRTNTFHNLCGFYHFNDQKD